jgi:hypothetical protein
MTNIAKRLTLVSLAIMPLVAGTPALALQLICYLPSAKDGKLLETLKIDVTKGNTASVWRKWERTSYWDEHEKNEQVLFHSLTTADGNKGTSSFSVLVIESRFVNKDLKIDSVSPPEVFFVDWGKARVAQINAPFTLEPPAQVDTRWECQRTD